MSNGFRHFLGVIAGLLLPPAIAVLLVFGVDGLTDIGTKVAVDKAASGALYTRLAMLAGAAIIIAIMAGSRLSPLASAIGGLAFTAAGTLWMAYPTQFGDLIERLPGNRDAALRTLVYHGMFVLIGVTLLASSFPLSRWRGLVRRLRGPLPSQAYEPEPYEAQPYASPQGESQRMSPQRVPDEAQVTFRSAGDPAPAEQIDVPGYRFLPRESSGPGRPRGYVTQVGEGATREMPNRPYQT